MDNITIEKAIQKLYKEEVEDFTRNELNREDTLFIYSRAELASFIGLQIKHMTKIDKFSTTEKSSISKIAGILEDNLTKFFLSGKKADTRATTDSTILISTRDGKYNQVDRSIYGVKANSSVVLISSKPGLDQGARIFSRLQKIIGNSKKKTFENTEVIKELNKFNTSFVNEDFNIGHLFNSSNITHEVYQEYDKIEGAIKDPALLKEFKKFKKNQFRKSILTVKKVYWEKEVEVGVAKRSAKVDNKALAKKGEIVVFTALMGSKVNQGAFSTLEGIEGDRLRKALTRWLGRNWKKIQGSPTIVQDFLKDVQTITVKELRKAAKDPRPVNKMSNTKPSSKSKRFGKNKKRTTIVAHSKPNTILAKDPPTIKNVTHSLINVKQIINEHLPEYLKKNMGKGASREILNWRTGRFANSAQVQTLIEAKGSKAMVIQGLITYMRSPYDVFRPGGRLHKPGRDPKLLIDKSIRQILREKALIQMSFRSELQ